MVSQTHAQNRHWVLANQVKRKADVLLSDCLELQLTEALSGRPGPGESITQSMFGTTSRLNDGLGSATPQSQSHQSYLSALITTTLRSTSSLQYSCVKSINKLLVSRRHQRNPRTKRTRVIKVKNNSPRQWGRHCSLPRPAGPVETRISNAEVGS